VADEPQPIRVLLVEDNDVFRQALILLLELQDGIEVVAAIPDGTAAVNAYREHRPDVVVMDFRLPGMDGVETTLALVDEYPEVAVVCLTASASPRELDALMAAGAIDHPAVGRGIAYLVAAQGADGFWNEPRYTATGFPRVFYLRYHGYAKYFPVWAMARYRNLKRANSPSVAYGM